MSGFTLRGAQVLDASGGFEGPLDVAVRDGWIAAVGRDLSADGQPSLDADGLWLMPGVIDCHDHLAFSSLDPMELMRIPVTEWALEAVRNLRRTLECGVTFVRDAGGADAGIRRALARELVPGPELQVAVMVLSQTGGHMDGFLPGPGREQTADYVIPDYPGRPPFLVDGVEATRKAVRELLRAGADWIKLCTTGGLLSPHDDPLAPELTLEEVQVAVFEAGRRGKSVMAHAFGGEGIDLAVEAGVRSIEHGLFLDEDQARAMARAGCSLVPTLAVFHDLVGWAEEGRLPSYAADKARLLEGRLGAAVAVAHEEGVSIALGTDFVAAEQHGTNLREIGFLHRAGLSPEEALLAATANGAELCGVGGHLGRIAAGHRFDAIVLERDPSDLTVFDEERPALTVFKAGRAVRACERLGVEAAW